ncbi:MAG: glycosyltransferase family 2 protein [Lachnospiraceae bacterium]|jgi:glycosyltransferase involved in cell wall biosynthesis|nr:glycosyltransferase family 2 protein [Lachnospiraceae bacterium]MCI8967698.1 glycosyltransferase family 2 protein [Lachnospiraceae bacterium]MDE6990488.1 glycosyltransferase family 2 protein [Lachnospiraceae bacterium]
MDNSRQKGVLYIVVPCYNEEEALEISAGRLMEKLHDLKRRGIISDASRIVFVDDGSKDRTWELVKGLYGSHEEIKGLRFAHNRGHQNAILAGMMYARTYCDYTITIDADLQQDINAMEDFIKAYEDGSEIVFGVRNSRNTDGLFKKLSATLFYKTMRGMGCDIYENSADYRLMSAKALEALSGYREVNLFLRGIIPDIGLKSSVVHFDVFPRMQGKTKYSLTKMFTLAADGITSFSIKPIRMVFAMGVLALLVGFGMVIHIIYEHYFGYTVSGWSSILMSIWVLGGAVLMSLGIIGEYVGRNYMETKQRPRYYFWEILSRDEGQNDHEA